MIERSEPIFPVRDLSATIAFYRDVLGGEGEWSYGDPPGFGGIRLGGKQVLFELQPGLGYPVRGLGHMLFAEDIDACHDRHTAAGAPIVEPIGDRPWGFREYVVEDPSGVRLRFCGLPEHQKPLTATDTMPEAVVIEHRKPTAAEYEALTRSVGWADPDDYAVWLDVSHLGVVAIDTDTDQAVGMARAVADAHRWCSVWDVIVRPSYQSKRVGTALMEHLVRELRGTAPSGTKVCLFTYHHSFYERLGFEKQKCSVLTL
ncbi:MAG: GNAT family N-acetyltransferase [Planctomycetota bacterium]